MCLRLSYRFETPCPYNMYTWSCTWLSGEHVFVMFFSLVITKSKKKIRSCLGITERMGDDQTVGRSWLPCWRKGCTLAGSFPLKYQLYVTTGTCMPGVEVATP